MPPLVNSPFSSPGLPGTEINPANRTAVAGTAPNDFSQLTPEAGIYIETGYQSNSFAGCERIDWQSIVRCIDGEESKATLLIAALDASKLGGGGQIGSEHLTQLLDQLHPNRRILILLSRGSDPAAVLFLGYVVSRTASWSEKHQAITCAAISEGEERLKHHPDAQIVGRLMRRFPFRDPAEFTASGVHDLVEVEALPPVFNAESKGNRLATPLTFNRTDGQEGTHRIYAFTEDGATAAKEWNYADALRYTAYFYARKSGVDVEDFLRDTDELAGMAPVIGPDPFTTRLTQRVEHVSIASMSALEALTALCKGAGLHYEVVLRLGQQFYLRVFAEIADANEEAATHERLMGAPKARNIPRDRPFNDYTGLTPGDIAQRNEARQADLALDNRAINDPLFVGGANDYEVTLLLRPGWMSHVNLDNMASAAQAEAAVAYWEEEFGLDDTDVDEETGLPKSVYHTKHPDHWKYADVGRLWVFPDDLSYMAIIPATGLADMDHSPYARDLEPWSSPHLYSPYIFEGTKRSRTNNLNDSLMRCDRIVPFPVELRGG